jgi:ADP-ribose pyrophosphatase YjhB (NUDIX family)/RimJ/RimL family protein N-acetyltransferase
MCKPLKMCDLFIERHLINLCKGELIMELDPIKAFMDSLNNPIVINEATKQVKKDIAIYTTEKEITDNLDWYKAPNYEEYSSIYTDENGDKFRVRVETLVFNDKGQILIKLTTPKQKKAGFYYLFPGGGVDKGLPFIDQAKNEVKEETRITPKKIKFTGIGHKTYFPVNADGSIEYGASFEGHKAWRKNVGYVGSVTFTYVALKGNDYKGYIAEKDRDDEFATNGKWVYPEEVPKGLIKFDRMAYNFGIKTFDLQRPNISKKSSKAIHIPTESKNKHNPGNEWIYLGMFQANEKEYMNAIQIMDVPYSDKKKQPRIEDSKGRFYRARTELLIIDPATGKLLIANRKDKSVTGGGSGRDYSLPGGGIDEPQKGIVYAAKREAEEEMLVDTDFVKYVGIAYTGKYPDKFDDYGCITFLCVGQYKKKHIGYIKVEDRDPRILNNKEWVDINSLNLIPPHKKALELYKKSLHEDVEILDEGMLDMTFYHGSPYKFDVLKPTGVNIGNKIEKPKWSLFLWRSKDIAISWAMFMIIKKNIFRLGKHIYTLDENGNREYFIFLNTNKDFHMVLREDMYDEIKKISIGLKCYVYTVSTKFYKVGLGNEISKPEFTVDEEIVPDKIEEITITKNMFDKYVTKVDRKTCKYLLSIMNKNNARSIFKYLYHDNDEIMEKYRYIYNKIKTGEIKPGDDLEGILNKKFPKNIQESSIEFNSMNKIEIVEEENNVTNLEKAKSMGINTNFLIEEIFCLESAATKESIIIDTLNDFKNKKIKDDFRPNKIMPLRDIDQIYKDGKANCVDIAYCLHDICKRNNIDHTIGNVKWEFNKNKSHGHVFIVIKNNNNYTSYHYFGDTRTIKIIQKGNSYLECVKLTGEQLKQEASFIPDNVDQKEYIYSIKDLDKVDNRTQLASNQKDFIDLLSSSNTSYQDALSIYNQLSDKEKNLAFPRGRYVDSPNLITRAIQYNNNKPIGFIDAYDFKQFGKNTKKAFLIIAILPKYRKKNVDKKLLNDINNDLKGKYTHMIWKCDKENTASAKCAERLGFTLYKQTKNSVTYIKKV